MYMILSKILAHSLAILLNPPPPHSNPTPCPFSSINLSFFYVYPHPPYSPNLSLGLLQNLPGDKKKTTKNQLCSIVMPIQQALTTTAFHSVHSLVLPVCSGVFFFPDPLSLYVFFLIGLFLCF